MSLFTKKLVAFCAALVLVALAAMALPTARVDAQTPGQGKVEGQIVNGTKGAQPSSTAGLTVTLLSVAQGATGMISSTAQTDANGRFIFPNLSTLTTTQYLATTSYAGIPYFSDIFAFDGTLTTVPLSMTVYETTNDPSVIRVTQTHLIMNVDTRLLNVTEVVVVQGTSDRVLVGATAADPHKATLVIPILEGATDVQFSNPPDADGTTLQGNGVLTYTQRLYPGDNSGNSIVMHYAVPFNPPTYSANLKLPYDTATLRFLAADVGETIQASSALSAPVPFLAPGGARYIQTSGSDLKAGTTISVTMTNLPATVAPPPGSDTTNAPVAAPTNNNLQLLGGVVLAAAALLVLGLLLIPVLRRRQERTAAADSTADERMELLQAMADLDDEFEAGKISEAEYKEQRARLKAELLELPSRGEE